MNAEVFLISHCIIEKEIIEEKTTMNNKAAIVASDKLDGRGDFSKGKRIKATGAEIKKLKKIIVSGEYSLLIFLVITI